MYSRLFTVLALSTVVLASCTGPTAVQYRLTFDTQEPGAVEELTNATLRVIARRLDRFSAGVVEQNVTQDAEGATVSLKISDAAAAETLEQEMMAPFDLQIMLATADAENADVTVEGFGAFNATGVTAEDIAMVVATPAASGDGGSVQIHFTESGLVEMRDVFRANVTKDLGLFVRGRLVSALTVASADMPNPLVIEGIPDPEIAMIFADDVNVGIHVTVTPL